jgi:hypothetical protein
MVGIGWAVGQGHLTNAANPSGDLSGDIDPGVTTAYRGGGAPSVRAGRMLNQTFMVDAYWGDWMVAYGTIPTKIRRSMQSWGLGLTYYPGNPTSPSGGFYLRAGGGIGQANTGQKEAEPGVAQKPGQRVSDYGYALVGEGGYEVWITPKFTAGLNFAGYYFGIDGDLVNTGWFTSFGFALNAHF